MIKKPEVNDYVTSESSSISGWENGCACVIPHNEHAFEKYSNILTKKKITVLKCATARVDQSNLCNFIYIYRDVLIRCAHRM